jgi:hypothetical protein
MSGLIDKCWIEADPIIFHDKTELISFSTQRQQND